MTRIYIGWGFCPMGFFRRGFCPIGLFPWGFSPKGLFTFCAPQKHDIFSIFGKVFKIPLFEGHLNFGFYVKD